MSSSMRQDQQDAYLALREAFRRNRSVLYVSPTGSGKTFVAGHIISGALQRNKRVLYTTHLREIIFDVSERLHHAGITHKFILAGMEKKVLPDVALASIQTLTRREAERFDLIIIDEAHHAVSRSYRSVLAMHGGAKILGMTATPIRADGCGLGGIFQEMVIGVKPSVLREAGVIVPARILCPSKPDLSKVRVRRGDYDEGDLEKAVDQPKLVGDIVEQWEKNSIDRQTIVFASSCKHANHICESFVHAGHAAEYIDGDTPHRERKLIFARMRSGETRLLVNVGIATEGVDLPSVGAIVLARPTKSLSLFIQMAGRGLRADGTKVDCLILDHSGSSEDHGYPDEDIPWTLEPEVSIQKERAAAKKKDPTPRVCPECFTLMKPEWAHCVCGYVKVVQKKSMRVVDGDLVELQRRKATIEQKERQWESFLYSAAALHQKVGVAAHRYRQRYGCWPAHSFKMLPHGKYEWNLPAQTFLAMMANRAMEAVDACH